MKVLAILAAAFALGVGACGSSKSAPDLGPCVADAQEPNDSATARKALGSIQDDDAPGQSSPSPKRIQKELTLHTETDVDWFDVDVRDTGIGGSSSRCRSNARARRRTAERSTSASCVRARPNRVRATE